MDNEKFAATSEPEAEPKAEPKIAEPRVLSDTLPDTPSTTVKQITVYLTGFGPFRDVRRNPSYDLVSKFSAHRPLELRIDGHIYTINIRVHPLPVNVCYHHVRDVIPEIWRAGGFDYIIHVGVAPYEQYKIERFARGMGYCQPDADDEFLPSKDWTEEMFRYKGNPDDICNWVRAGLRKDRPDEDITIIPSSDAGQYLCEYIYYNSLRQACAKKKDKKYEEDQETRKRASKKVLFFHIPPENKPYSLDTGKVVLEQLILGMVAEGEGLLSN